MLDPNHSNRLFDFRASRSGVARPNLGRQLAIQLQRHRLADATGIRDPLLLDRLVECGFCVRTISALQLAPVAFAAWGSGNVTSQEFQRAIDAIFDSSLVGSSKAIRRFRGWLKERPHDELYALWEDFVSAQVGAMWPRQTKAHGKRLYAQAKRVALASGGVLGIGRICRGEAEVLNAIRRVYNLD